MPTTQPLYPYFESILLRLKVMSNCDKRTGQKCLPLCVETTTWKYNKWNNNAEMFACIRSDSVSHFIHITAYIYTVTKSGGDSNIVVGVIVIISAQRAHNCERLYLTIHWFDDECSLKEAFYSNTLSNGKLIKSKRTKSTIHII